MFLRATLLICVGVAVSHPIFRVKRQIPFVGGLGSLGLPGVSKPDIVQPAAGKPCPVGLMPQQLSGGGSFRNGQGFGFNVPGTGKDGGEDIGFNTGWGDEIGGGIFGGLGPKAEALPCEPAPGPAPPTGGQSSSQPQPNPQAAAGQALNGPSDDDIVRALANNPDLLRRAIQQNPDLLSGRSKVESALTSNPELVRQALINNPALLKQYQNGGGGPAPPQPQISQKSLSPNGQAEAGAQGQAQPQPNVQETWEDHQKTVFAAFKQDPFLMQHAFEQDPLRLKAALMKGKFDLGNMDEQQTRQALYDHPYLLKPLLARDNSYTKFLEDKYNLRPGGEYTRANPTPAEMAYKHVEKDDRLLRSVIEQNPNLVNEALKKQGVDPSKVDTNKIVGSYRTHPEMLKLMLLQNPKIVEKINTKYEQENTIYTGSAAASI